MMGPAVFPMLNITELTCKDDFFEVNFTCLPRCNRWDGRPQDLIATLEDIVRLICSFINMIATGLFFTAFFIRRKTL